ncbi:MAG: hypothetical protein ACTSUU_07905 [Candidatus Thorarchaeota archaeon]
MFDIKDLAAHNKRESQLDKGVRTIHEKMLETNHVVHDSYRVKNSSNESDWENKRTNLVYRGDRVIGHTKLSLAKCYS